MQNRSSKRYEAVADTGPASCIVKTGNQLPLRVASLRPNRRVAMRMQVQRQGAIVHQNFAPDTEFAVVAPLKQTSELLQELADMDRCMRSSLLLVYMRRCMPMLRGHTLLHSRVAGF